MAEISSRAMQFHAKKRIADGDLKRKKAAHEESPKAS
jgi:hypothetical protein